MSDVSLVSVVMARCDGFNVIFGVQCGSNRYLEVYLRHGSEAPYNLT